MLRVPCALCLASLAGAVTVGGNSLESTGLEEVQRIKDLHGKLAGTTWVHDHKGGEFPFTFGAADVIEDHATGQGQPWRVVGSSEVIVGQKPAVVR